MAKLLIPLIFMVAGLGAGIGAGVFLSSSGEAEDTLSEQDAAAKTDQQTDAPVAPTERHADASGGSPGFEYLKMTKQFVVPVVEDDEIRALVTMSLSLEAKPSVTETFYAIEPKLRDGFLQVLFDHANTGGFDGIFTQSDNLDVLRKSLLEVVRKELGSDVSQVLITSVNRQDS